MQGQTLRAIGGEESQLQMLALHQRDTSRTQSTAEVSEESGAAQDFHCRSRGGLCED
jgi:hypothetical protein